jgi:hypothetical protein
MRIAVIAFFCVLIAAAGCDNGPAAPTNGAAKGSTADPANPPLGAYCTVQFNRNALGAAMASPVPPMTNVMNGADVSIDGKLLKVDADWVVLESQVGAGTSSSPWHMANIWIPRQNILLMRFDAK